MKIEVQCGDLILFARPCMGMDLLSSATCFAAKTTAQSVYDHVGVVVEDPTTKKLHLLEANAKGVTIHLLEDRLSRTTASKIAVRKLLGFRDANFKQELWKLASERNGKAYNRSMFQMTSALISSYTNKNDVLNQTDLKQINSTLAMLKNEMDSDHNTNQSLTNALLKVRYDQLMSQAGEISREPASVGRPATSASQPPPAADSYYCSQIVAEVLLQLGVIVSHDRAASDYLPADFSSSTVSKNLHGTHHNGTYHLENSGTLHTTLTQSAVEQPLQHAYLFSPDLQVTSPRDAKLTMSNGRCYIECPRVTLESAPATSTSTATSTPATPQSATTNITPTTTGSVAHEWQLSAEDMLPPQITGQLAMLGIDDSATYNYLEVASGSVDVLVSEKCCELKESVAHLRTVGMLTPGKYYVTTDNHGNDRHQSQLHEHRHTLSQLQMRHDAVYLRAREKAKIKLVSAPIDPTATISSAPLIVGGKGLSPQKDVHLIGTIAPQIMFEVAAGIDEANRNVYEENTTRKRRNPTFVDLGELQYALIGGPLSEKRIHSITSLDMMLIRLIYEAYLQHNHTNGAAVAPIRLAVLCEVDNALTAGRDAGHILLMLRQYNNLHNLDSHSRAAVNAKLGHNGESVKQVEAIIAQYKKGGLVTPAKNVGTAGAIRATSADGTAAAGDSSERGATVWSAFGVSAALCAVLFTSQQRQPVWGVNTDVQQYSQSSNASAHSQPVGGVWLTRVRRISYSKLLGQRRTCAKVSSLSFPSVNALRMLSGVRKMF